MTRKAGRILAVDVPLGLLLGLLVLAVTRGQTAFEHWGPPGQGGPGPGWPDRVDAAPLSPATHAAVFAAAAGVMVRRLRPRTALAVTASAVTAFLALGNPFGPILLLLAVVVFSTAAALPLRAWAPWTALAVPLLLSGYLDRPYLGLLNGELLTGAVFGLTLLLAPAALGVIVRTRREGARRDREQELRRYAYEERLRIAREVHDVVGHSLSVISMQAGVALHVLHKRPEQVVPSLEAIRRTSRDALEELRGTLAVFRDPGVGGDDERAPLPGLDRLEDLVAAITAAGRRARVRTDGDPVELPAAVDHAAYRIVQEALTNVVRHAEGAEADVRIAYRPMEVVVEVTDNGPARPEAPPAEGNGLAGMRERARAVGGALHAGPRSGGGFAVRAELPLPTGGDR